MLEYLRRSTLRFFHAYEPTAPFNDSEWNGGNWSVDGMTLYHGQTSIKLTAPIRKIVKRSHWEVRGNPPYTPRERNYVTNTWCLLADGNVWCWMYNYKQPYIIACDVTHFTVQDDRLVYIRTNGKLYREGRELPYPGKIATLDIHEKKVHLVSVDGRHYRVRGRNVSRWREMEGNVA